MEIKPQELRLGNIIQREVWGEGVVTKIGPDGFVTIQPKKLMGEISCTCIELSGIELTLEWLTRLGFQYCNDPEFDNLAAAKMYFKGMIQVGAFRTDQNETVKYTSYLVKHPTFLNGNPINHINTVHQLQNLYFAVSGEELAIDKTSLKN